MNHPAAERLALDLIERMRPYCRRIEIAGSIRRNCAEVRDLEIVAVPYWEPRTVTEGLLEISTQVNLLHEWATSAHAGIRWVKTGTPPEQIIDWQIKPEGRYWRGIVGNGIHLDLFLAQPDNFGLILAIRTGSREFSQALVQEAARQRYPSRDGYLRRGESGEPIPTPEEATVFDLLGLEPTAPAERTGPQALRPRKPQSAPAPDQFENVEQVKQWRQEVLLLARAAGYPDNVAPFGSRYAIGPACWGYAVTAATPGQLRLIEVELGKRLRNQELRRAA